MFGTFHGKTIERLSNIKLVSTLHILTSWENVSAVSQQVLKVVPLLLEKCQQVGKVSQHTYIMGESQQNLRYNSTHIYIVVF